MTVIADTSAIVTLANNHDPDQGAVSAVRHAERGPLIIPAPVTSETDYMLTTRIGPAASQRFFRDLAAGVFRVECLEPEEYALVVALDQRYADLRPGLADLSIIVLARRFNTRRILTFDRRHFGVVEPLQGGVFELLPDMPGSPTAP